MGKKLLFSVTRKDFDIQTFRSGGKGGQHQNKTDSGVRIIHRDSGAVGECRDSRSQHQNKKVAFDRCVSSYAFKRWHAMKTKEMLEGETIEEKVNKQLDEKYLKTEVKIDGKWVDEKDMSNKDKKA